MSPVGAEGRAVLSRVRSRLGVEAGRRAEGRLRQRRAQGPGSVSARHGGAAGHSRRPVSRIQLGVGRSGVKLEGQKRVLKDGARCIECYNISVSTSCAGVRYFPEVVSL